LTHKVRPMFEQRVLAVSEDVIFKWRMLVEAGRKAGHTYPQPDLFFAATGLHHGLTIVTRDTREYERARVAVLYPWNEAQGTQRRCAKWRPRQKREATVTGSLEESSLLAVAARQDQEDLAGSGAATRGS